MRRVLFVWLLCLAAPLHACLWDSDTLATEAKGLPGTLEIITGRFERNPPLFYEMRLARVGKEIKAQPTKLELYDDAGVACDRLHKGDEAIAWMQQKRAHLKPFPQDKEHWYRYHANLGTFQAHHWLRSGANRKNIAEMKTARDNIKRAIQINPNAHFGREKYQLMAMEWIINPPKDQYKASTPGFIYLNEKSASAQAKEAQQAITGLIGLIALGNAWESIDVFQSLHDVLQQDNASSTIGHSFLAYMSKLRSIELIDTGKKSLAPKAPKNPAILKARLDGIDMIKNIQQLNVQYKELRAEAEDYQKRRTTYMMARLNAGRHPDTDKTFWNEWKDSGPPPIPDEVEAQKAWDRRKQQISDFLVILIAVLITCFIWHTCRLSLKMKEQT